MARIYTAAEQLAGHSLQQVGGDYVDYSLLPYPLHTYAINTFTTMGCPFRCSYCADGRAPHFVASPDGQMEQLKKLLPARNLVHFFDSVLGFSQEGIRNVCNEEFDDDRIKIVAEMNQNACPHAVRYAHRIADADARN